MLKNYRNDVIGRTVIKTNNMYRQTTVYRKLRPLIIIISTRVQPTADWALPTAEAPGRASRGASHPITLRPTSLGCQTADDCRWAPLQRRTGGGRRQIMGRGELRQPEGYDTRRRDAMGLEVTAIEDQMGGRLG